MKGAQGGRHGASGRLLLERSKGAAVHAQRARPAVLVWDHNAGYMHTPPGPHARARTSSWASLAARCARYCVRMAVASAARAPSRRVRGMEGAEAEAEAGAARVWARLCSVCSRWSLSCGPAWGGGREGDSWSQDLR